MVTSPPAPIPIQMCIRDRAGLQVCRGLRRGGQLAGGGREGRGKGLSLIHISDTNKLIARLVIFGRAVRDGESEAVKVNAATLSPNPLMPKQWYEYRCV